MFLAVGYAKISSRAPGSLGTAYVPILISEVEQEQRPSGNGDREAIVVGAGLCDGEDERAYTVYDPILGEKYLIYFQRSKNRIQDNLLKDSLPKPNLPNVKDNLPKIIRQIVPEPIFGKLSFG